MSVINLKEQKVIYLTNAFGEETGHKEIAENIYEWYGKNCVANDWLQYMVEINGEFGILALQEFSHPDCDDFEDNKYNWSEDWRKSTVQEIGTHLKSVSQKIDERINFKVLLGQETGFMARHEVCIWFPFSTEKKFIEQTFEKIKDIQLFFKDIQLPY